MAFVVYQSPKAAHLALTAELRSVVENEPPVARLSMTFGGVTPSSGVFVYKAPTGGFLLRLAGIVITKVDVMALRQLGVNILHLATSAPSELDHVLFSDGYMEAEALVSQDRGELGVTVIAHVDAEQDRLPDVGGEARFENSIGGAYVEIFVYAKSMEEKAKLTDFARSLLAVVGG